MFSFSLSFGVEHSCRDATFRELFPHYELKHQEESKLRSEEGSDSRASSDTLPLEELAGAQDLSSSTLIVSIGIAILLAAAVLRFCF
jgi:hypothetical protein